MGLHFRLMLRSNMSGALDVVITALVTNPGFLVGGLQAIKNINIAPYELAFEIIDELAERICLDGILKRLAKVSSLKGKKSPSCGPTVPSLQPHKLVRNPSRVLVLVGQV